MDCPPALLQGPEEFAMEGSEDQDPRAVLDDDLVFCSLMQPFRNGGVRPGSRLSLLRPHFRAASIRLARSLFSGTWTGWFRDCVLKRFANSPCRSDLRDCWNCRHEKKFLPSSSKLIASYWKCLATCGSVPWRGCWFSNGRWNLVPRKHFGS